VQSTFTRQDINVLGQAEAMRELLDEFPSMFDTQDTTIGEYRPFRSDFKSSNSPSKRAGKGSKKKRFGFF
ncbi:MAG: hypothetical protein ACTSRU_03840, partial [Candidatus Hodarchaeales archaeon]